MTRNALLLLAAAFMTGAPMAWPQPFAADDTDPVIERWMYPFNAAPCDRPAGSAFGTFGDEAGVDTRHAQHLLGWDTSALAATNQGPARYVVRSCRVTLTINRGDLFAFDPTPDDFRSYFETNHPGRLPDADVGRPVEMFGVGFRNGYDEATFEQCAPFGSAAPGERNTYAAGWSTHGLLVDVSNNVGKTNAAWPRFEVAPFAVGQTTNAAPGNRVPTGARMTFDLDLGDPLVLTYVQRALHTGRLRLMVSALHETEGQFGPPAYPDFTTRFNEAVLDPTRLEIDGTVIRDLDTDGDELPDDWEQFYFDKLAETALDDSDGDGVVHLDEWRAGTDPTQAVDALRLLGMERRGEGNVALRFRHAASRRYTAEFTEDFNTWTELTNRPVYMLGTARAELIDTSVGAASRFYRLHADVALP